jgi:hypothetical protein
MFGNRILRRIVGSKMEEVTGEEENCISRSFIICNFHKMLSA